MNKSIKRSVLFSLFTGLFLMSGFAQTSVKEDVPKGWHLLNKQTSGYYGISLDRAYEFLKGKKSTPLIVAVIDSGVDTTHEDLKGILWHNPGEIPGNGIDDDKNGYVDDVYGWNFLGGRDGRNVKEDSYEAARVYHKYKSKFEEVSDPSTLSKEDKELYEMWSKAKQDVVGDVDIAMLKKYKEIEKDMIVGDSVIQADLKKKEYNCKDLESYNPTSAAAQKLKQTMTYICGLNKNNDISNEQIIEDLQGEIRKMEAAEKAPKDFRGEIVKDNYNDFSDRFYGNGDVMANTPFHGTHVSGIIAAIRNNGKGVDGIADNVKIMMIRAVPDGDEHDKDIALAIRYAADNGAKVINSQVESWTNEFLHASQNNKGWTAIVLSLLLASDIFLPIPSSIVSTGAGYLLGFINGALTSFIGMTAGCIIGYGFAFSSRKALRWIGADSFNRLEKFFQRSGAWAIALTRPIPVLAEAAVLFAGLSRMKFSQFMLVSILSNLGISLVYAAVGAYSVSVNSFFLAFVGAIAIPGIAKLIEYWYERRSK